jgi:hypothetical protein
MGIESNDSSRLARIFVMVQKALWCLVGHLSLSRTPS